MKHILATTALVALTAAPAFAQTDATTPTDDTTTTQDMAPATGTDDPMLEDGAQAPAATDETTTMDSSDDMTVMGDETYLSDEDRSALTADDLIGAAVHDMNDENIGNIDDIVLTEDGQVGDVIVDVGGFLGIGARSVAFDFADLQIGRDEGGMTSSLRVWTQVTEEELENMPEWTGDN